ncbi:hypothetical protein CY34DRAFT_812472 [Suillus luteus UH-Slu-Lm8-n1]|uniref:Uncharacterized protein n=1 Tax=Suillus luteus UH-Slu-Lm8-n1 TaxID=930992 RepID=A0A0D0ASX8_9AGAM|nr:hypothetical protein CY34DRAFT_812472 [Suillus luteus UH-Slu-Lm8-n1]
MENEEAQNVCKEEVWAVAVSRDGPWVVTAGGDVDRGVLKAEDQGQTIWTQVNSWLVRSRAWVWWAQFDSQQTRRSLNLSQMWGSALKSGISSHRNWM